MFPIKVRKEEKKNRFSSICFPANYPPGHVECSFDNFVETSLQSFWELLVQDLKSSYGSVFFQETITLKKSSGQVKCNFDAAMKIFRWKSGKIWTKRIFLSLCILSNSPSGHVECSSGKTGEFFYQLCGKFLFVVNEY